MHMWGVHVRTGNGYFGVPMVQKSAHAFSVILVTPGHFSPPYPPCFGECYMDIVKRTWVL